MLKYSQIINEETGLVRVGIGSNTEYYQSIGMVERDIEQSDVDNNWYLKEKCPHKSDEEKLKEAKEAKYQEANTKARRYLESGEALFTFEKDENIYHIEATDGNIAKIGLKATALLMAGDTKTTFPWNTKEDINIQINALEGKFIAEGLGEVQDEVWTIKFPNYVNAINKAKTIKQVEAIEINYEGVN